MPADFPECLRHVPVRSRFGAGMLARLGEEASSAGATHVLLATDPGIMKAGHAERAEGILRDAGIHVTVFSGVEENPTTEHVARGLAVAEASKVDFIVGIGGGSAMDCAKGVNFLLTNGGRMQDYWGVGKATKRMLPMIAIPTTAGTGSEAQSFALITDPATHQKMACGDKKALCVCAILDSDLTRTVPRMVAAATGIDAVTHSIETSASLKRNDASRMLSREAWRRLSDSFEKSIADPNDDDARSEMLLGAHFAGAAIENSMLGAAHACANPLTAKYGIVHGVAVGLLLPHVIRFNAAAGENPYSDLDADAERLARRVEGMLASVGLPTSLRALGVSETSLPEMAEVAATQWTARFNPREVDASTMHDLYRAAMG
ncbi:MAG: iron-containing alcohol dehydrogenase [Phycisphaerales bacterium]|nr:iron-containing alcohol dehydrogenase [Phycisphaerales bacterium]MCB9862545.1 iron-containing alcohol dehydrogenase [Phycisphaerales bacterium]